MNSDIRLVVVHISDSPQGRGDDASTIHHWHRERGFQGIGYHFVVLEDGQVQAGRPEYWIGAHAKGHNVGSLGVCCIADHEGLTSEQDHMLYLLLREICDRYPHAVVCGHRDLDPSKDCPGFDVSAWLESKARIHRRH